MRLICCELVISHKLLFVFSEMDNTMPCLQRSSAEAVLKELQAQPDAWTKVDTILERSTTEQTKFFALQVF